MALRYTVLSGFNHGDQYYTRENADEVKALPREVRDELIKAGVIQESDDRAPAKISSTASEKGA